MTNALATVGLTYDSVDLQASDLQVFLEITHGLNETPSVRGVDVVVPGLAGRIEGNRINDVLVITLEGLIRADPSETTPAGARASYRDNVQTMRELFAPARLRAELVATLEDGTSISINARPMPGMIWSEPIKSEIAQVSVELEAYGDWTVGGS
jgi:hypothetical protein